MPSIVSLIEYEEGWRDQPYLCSEGYPTVGYGFKIGPKGADLKLYQLTLPKAAGVVWLTEYLTALTKRMLANPVINPAYRSCDPVRQAVLISMAYQMGTDGLAQFGRTLAAVMANDWQAAAAGMLASKWARQTPERAKRHATQMLTGQWPTCYRD